MDANSMIVGLVIGVILTLVILFAWRYILGKQPRSDPNNDQRHDNLFRGQAEIQTAQLAQQKHLLELLWLNIHKAPTDFVPREAIQFNGKKADFQTCWDLIPDD